MRTDAKLQQIGNEAGIVLPRRMVQELGWTTRTALEFWTDSRRIFVFPVGTRAQRQERDRAVQGSPRRYGARLYRLA